MQEGRRSGASTLTPMTATRAQTPLCALVSSPESNSPAKPPAMPERIEAVLQLRELGRRITTISSGEPRGPQGDRNCHRIIII